MNSYGDGFCSSCLDQKFVYSWNHPLRRTFAGSEQCLFHVSSLSIHTSLFIETSVLQARTNQGYANYCIVYLKLIVNAY
jgi:hypothetical protein